VDIDEVRVRKACFHLFIRFRSDARFASSAGQLEEQRGASVYESERRDQMDEQAREGA
jgi:hypothetical protein